MCERDFYSSKPMWRLAVAVAAVAVAVVRAAAGLDYGDALTKSLLYFEAQRSGRLPYGQRVAWRGHSGLADGLEQGVDLVGGYYDAGDHVKFGLPMAFTVTMLSWGVLEYTEEIAAADELGHALEAIKWGTDYFIKAHTHPNVLWAQVGDGGTDHYCWQRPEDMTTSRHAYKLDEKSPGSDVAGETAAAMAAASVVFLESDRRYSKLLLQHAQQLFEFADKYRGKYDETIPSAKHYYASVSGYKDELLWAALWLHRATSAAAANSSLSEYYMNYIVKNAYELGGAGWAVAEFSWDIKFPGVQILAAKLLLEGRELRDDHRRILEQYRSKAEYYLCACLSKNGDGANVRRTPGGLLYLRRWNNMQYVVSATLLATVYSDYLRRTDHPLLRCPTGMVAPDELLSFARSQADYILGSNPKGLSYLVGFGENYPRRVHHRGASAVPHKQSKGFVGCMQGYYAWYGRQADNVNVLVGAVVGGPDAEDQFRDMRGNFMQTEACTYNTAPMVGVFAKLYRLQRESGGGSDDDRGRSTTKVVNSQ